MLIIENDQYLAEINPLGAELCRLQRKADGKEIIWSDATGQYWRRHAPVLFPAIGRSNNDRYLLNHTAFSMPQHGFARDCEFTVVPQTRAETAVFQLNADKRTMANYPFLFSLQLTYTLKPTGVEIEFVVQNYGDSPMPYALGYHPGFCLTKPLARYELVLQGVSVPLKRWGIGPAPFRDGTIQPLASEGNRLALNQHLLDDGLLIVDAQQATSATVQTVTGEPLVTLTLQDFDYLTLWTPEHKQAPFLCVEPFAGLPDQYGQPSDWFRKPGNRNLPAGGTDRYHLDVTV